MLAHAWLAATAAGERAADEKGDPQAVDNEPTPNVIITIPVAMN